MGAEGLKHRTVICVIVFVQVVFGGAAFSQRYKSLEEQRREIKGKWKILLEEAIKDADKIEVQSPIEDGKVFHVIEGSDKIKGFLDAVDISERRSTDACECLGEGLLVFYQKGERVAALSFHHSESLRWRDGPWVADAQLTRKSRIELSQWFRSEGFGLFEQVRRDNIASRQRHKRELWLSITVLVLFCVLSLVLLCSVGILFVGKYRRYLPKAVMICVVLFAVLVVAYLLIYWSLMLWMNDPSRDGLFLDVHPFDTVLVFSLNWHVPGMLVLIAAALILTRKTKKSVAFWICLAGAAALICGFFVLAYHVYFNFFGQDSLSIDVWWL